jgi:hypothetical protein
MRHLSLMRILCCRARLPASASRRFPGGDRKSSSFTAASIIVSLRVAGLWTALNRFDLPVSNRACVSLHLKPSVPPFENHDDFSLARNHPVVQLYELALQPVQLPEVDLASGFLCCLGRFIE